MTVKVALPSIKLLQLASVIESNEVILQAKVVKFDPFTHDPLFPHLIFHSYVVDVFNPFKVYNCGPRVFGIVVAGTHDDAESSLYLKR